MTRLNVKVKFLSIFFCFFFNGVFYPSNSAYAESLIADTNHLNIRLFLSEGVVFPEWETVCNLLVKSVAPDTGPWGFGAFQSSSCVFGTADPEGNLGDTFGKISWNLELRVFKNEIKIDLVNPKFPELKTLDTTNSRTLLKLKFTPQLREALTSYFFIELVAAYVLNDLSFFSQVTKNNIEGVKGHFELRPDSLLPNPQLTFEFLKLWTDLKNGNIRVKVVKSIDLEENLEKRKIIWAAALDGTKNLEKNLRKRINLELIRLKNVDEQYQDIKEEIVRKMAEEAKKKVSPELPVTYSSEFYGGYWPLRWVGASADNGEAGLNLDIFREKINQIFLAFDYQSYLANRAYFWKLRGQSGFLISVNLFSEQNTIDLEQALGFSMAGLRFKLAQGVAPSGSYARLEFPFYHIQIALARATNNLRFKLFLGVDTPLKMALVSNILTTGAEMSLPELLGKRLDHFFLNEVFFRYTFRKFYFRNELFLENELESDFAGLKTHSFSIGVRKVW